MLYYDPYNIMNITDAYAQMMKLVLPRKKVGRIVRYYDPKKDKPQGRNEPCLCGSKRKFKHCCISKNK